MLEIRDATDADKLKGTAGLAEFAQVSVEDGEVTGVVACSGINRDVYLHDLEYWGKNPTVAPLLLRRGIRWCSAKAHKLGQPNYFANVSVTAPNVFDMCIKRGAVHQVIFKMPIKEVKE